MGHILRDSFSFCFIRLFRISLQPCRFTICQQRAREFALWLYIGPKYYKVVLYGLVKSEILSLITMSDTKVFCSFWPICICTRRKKKINDVAFVNEQPNNGTKAQRGSHHNLYPGDWYRTGQDRGSHHHVHCHLRIIKFPLAKLCFFRM